MINLLQMNFKAKLLFLLFILNSINCFSQFNISYPQQAESLTVCNGSKYLFVRISVVVSSSSNNNVTINFPQGIEYVFGSLVVTSGSLNIIETGGTVSTPTFAITPTTANLSNYVEFKLLRKATCNSISLIDNNVIFKDAVTVTGSAGTTIDNNTSVNSYLVNKPSIIFNAPVTQTNAIIGNTYTRTFSITNGSDGCANSIYFSIDYPSNGIQLISLKLGSLTLSPTSVVGTKSYYTINSSYLPGNNLCNGESITLTETYKIKICDAVTNYSTGWGCDPAPASWCQTVTGSGDVAMASGVPSLTAFTATKSGFVDSCTAFTETFALTNGGTGAVTAASMFNAKFRFGGGASSAMSTFRWDYFNMQSATIGGVPVTIVGGNVNTIATIDVKDLFTTDPDGAGVGLDDVDGDGFYDDLPAGKTVTIVVTMKINCSLLNCPAEVSTVYGVDADVQYTTMCSSTVVTAVKQRAAGGIGGGQFAVFSEKSYAPANVSNMVPFNTRFSVGFYDISMSGNVDTANTRYQYVITLPAGLSLSGTGNAVWRNNQYPVNAATAGTAVTVSSSVVGGATVLTITSPSNIWGYVNLDLVYDCSVGPGGAVNIPYIYKRLDNIVTGCTCNPNIWCGTNVIANVICPSPCPLGGPSLTLSKVERADNSLGWTNNTLATRQLRSAISAYDLAKALYLDDIDITTNGVQNTISSNNLHLKFEVSKLVAQAGDILTPISVDVVLKTSGGLVIASGNVTTFSITGSTTEQVIDWDLSSILPGGTIAPTTIIETVSHYTVSSNSFPNHDVQTGKKLYLYNNVSGSEYYCNFAVPEMYLVSPVITDAHNGGAALTASACNSLNVGSGTSYYAYRFDAGGTVFLNEVRPGFLPTRYEFTVPAGYELDYVTNGNYGGTLTPTSVVGSTYSYDLAAVTYPITVVNTYSTIFNVYLKPTCATPPSGPILHTRLDYVPYYYHYAGTSPLPTANMQKDMSLAYNTSTRPAIGLTNQSGSVQAARPTESFIVRMNSTGTTTAPYTWFAIPNTSGVTITGIYDGATPLTLLSYTGGIWVKLSTTGLASGAYKDYRIDFTYTTCTSTTINVEGGWNCSAYPTDPTAYTCGKATVPLTFTPVYAAIEINTVTQPNAPVDLCTSIPFQFNVNSSGAGNSKNNYFIITLPIGTSIVPSSLQVEYPAGSGNWQTVSSTVSGNQITLNLTTHPNYSSQGLLGTLLATSNNDRLMNIRWNLATDCSFASGSRVKVKTTANNTCGTPATGSGTEIVSNPITINGSSPNYTTYNTISTATINECTSTNNTINFSTTILNGTTQSQEVIAIILPLGIGYTTGSLNCTSAFCPTFNSASILGDGRQQVLLNMPINASHGTVISYSINIGTISFNSVCGTNTIELNTYYKFGPITCPTVGSGVCNSINMLTGSASQSITINKPTFSLSANGYRDSSSPNDYNISVILTNTSSINHLASDVLTINYYCSDSSGNPTGVAIASSTINSAINTGNNFSLNSTFTYSLCNTNYGIVAVLSNSNNCICSTSNFHFIPSYIDAINDTFTITGCTTGSSSTNVINNDILNSSTLSLSLATISFISSSSPNVTLNGTNIAVASGTATGTYTLTYKICENLNSTNCDTAVATINFVNNVSGTISGNGSICGSTTISVALTGSAPWSITYTDGVTPTTVSGISTSPYTFTVFPSVPKTYTLTSVNDASCNANASNISGSAIIVGGKTWLGSSSNWFLASNWTPAGIPTGSDCVVIPITSNNPLISGSGNNALAGTLLVKNGATFIVNSNNSITVTDYVNVESGGVFQMDNNSSLVQINNLANTGDIIYKRDANVRDIDYVYWSSPVAGFNVSNIPSPLTFSRIYSWDTTVANSNGGIGNWVTSAGATMQTAKGYIAKSPSSFTGTPSILNGVFTGVPNNGNISYTISRGSYTGANYNGINGTQITNLSDNYNLIGNPYPSAIRASQFLFDNQSTLLGSVMLWKHGLLPNNTNPQPFYNTFTYNYSGADYLIYNFTGTSCCPAIGADLFIGAGQGFFVKMIDGPAASGTINFNNNLRNASYANNVFYKNGSTNLSNNLVDIERHRIWLDIISPTNETYRTLVGYVEGASNNYDNFFDAPTTLSQITQIYSKINNENYEIQGRQLPFDDTDEIPMGVYVSSAGNQTIAIASIDGLFTNQNIYLKDNLFNIIYDLKANPYQFTADVGEINDRFSLVFRNSLLNISINSLNNLVKVSTDINVSVHSSNEKIKSIVVYDLLGQKVKEFNNIDSNEFVIKTLIKNNAALFLKIKLENDTIETKKIIF